MLEWNILYLLDLFFERTERDVKKTLMDVRNLPDAIQQYACIPSALSRSGETDSAGRCVVGGVDDPKWCDGGCSHERCVVVE